MNVRPFGLMALAVALATTVSVFPVRAQQDDTPIQIGGSEVLLDIVATDGKGKPIFDLKPEEIEVYENGQKQNVTSFSLVRVGGRAGDAAAPAGHLPGALQRSPLRDYNLLMIVIDRSTLQKINLDATYKAAERFINERLQPTDLVAVFAAGRSLQVVQNFTNDKVRLLAAMKLVTGAADPGAEGYAMDKTSAPVFNASDRDEQLKASTDPALLQQIDLLPHTLDQSVSEYRNQIQARAIMYNILALTKTYSRLPGRKSVLLYSEGFPVTAPLEPVFDSMVGLANRNNFAFYTVDAAGLRADSGVGYAGARRSTGYENQNARMEVIGGETGLEREIKGSFRTSDTNKSLAELAERTGGLAVRNTNDLNVGFNAIEGDLRSYYALSYAPTNGALDGGYRTLSIKVSRKGVALRTRNGYFAAPGADAVLPYERPVLALLSNGSKPNDLAAAVSTSYFRRGAFWSVPVSAVVSAASLQPVPQPPPPVEKDNKKKEVVPVGPARSVFTVDAVALIKDSSGAVVSRLSRSATVSVAPDDVAAFKTRQVTVEAFPQPLLLAPGAYTIDVGVYDPVSKKASVVSRPLRLPPLPTAGAPALSGIVLSRQAIRVEDLGRENAASEPLALDGKVYMIPNVSGKFSKAQGDNVMVFFRAYGAPTAQYQAKLQIVKDNKLVTATAAMAMPAISASGEASFAPTFPIASLEPGSYRMFVYLLAPGSTTPVASGTTVFVVE